MNTGSKSGVPLRAGDNLSALVGEEKDPVWLEEEVSRAIGGVDGADFLTFYDAESDGVSIVVIHAGVHHPSDRFVGLCCCFLEG